MKKFSLSLLFAIMMLAMFATAASAQALPDPDNTDPGTSNVEETGIVTEPTRVENANQTGKGADTSDNFGEVIKSDGLTNKDGSVTTHKTHGEYQNNTNSCASCHQTHTSKGKQLLFADTTYQTCSACHDGTLGFYNVFETGADASANGAGTFGGSHANNMSIHQANDAVLVKAAPGGNASGTGTWTKTFNCASCHAPHGSYSDRLLHYNPNGMATTPVNMVGGVNLGGNQLVGLIPSATKPAASTFGLVLEDNAEGVLLPDAVTVAKAVYLYNGNTKQTTPMLYGYTTNGQPHFTHLAYTHPVHGTGRIEYGNADIHFNNEKGYFEAETQKGQEILTGSTSLVGQVSLAYTVDMDLQEVANIDGLKIYENNQAAYWTEKTFGTDLASTTPKNFVGQGVKLSNYCAACHVDYLAKSSTSTGVKSGSFSKSFRHTTNNASYTCARCHYAHGTDAELMMDADGNRVADLVAGGTDPQVALDYMLDTNKSSALKKFTNMTVCWACHNSSKATTIKNTNRPASHPNGMPLADIEYPAVPESGLGVRTQELSR